MARAAAGDYAGALEAFRKAVSLHPAMASAWVNLGNVFRLLGQGSEAGRAYRRAVELDPADVDAWHNYGLHLRDLDRDAQAVEAFERALAIRPQFLEARFARALALLGCGDLARGWPEYEVRWQLARLNFQRRPFTCPRWRGEALVSKRLLIWGEQGVGDEISGSTLLADVLDRGARVSVECRGKIAPLLQRTYPELEIVPCTDPPDPRLAEGFDYQVPLGSLAALLRPDVASFDRPWRALVPDPERVRPWREWVESLGPGLKVGICWRSSDMSGERALACTRLSEWCEVLSVPGVRFVSLQYDECAAELAEAERSVGVMIHRPPALDQFDDLDGVAALMSALDLVISAPTTVSLQAAALDRPTWQLLFGSDWHAHGTGTNLWFPRMTRFMRDADAGWAPAFRQIASLLAERARAAIGEGERGLARILELHSAGQLVAAEEAAIRTLLQGVKEADLYQALAVMAQQTRRPIDAVGHARRAAALAPDLPAPYLLIGEAARELGWREECEKGFALAFERAPDDPAVVLNWARCLRARGRSEEALNLYASLLQRIPACFEAYMELGTALFEAGCGDEAEQRYRQALALRPDSPQAAFNLANVLRTRGDLAGAQEAYLRALEHQPSMAAAWLSLGAIHHERCELFRALEAYERALELDPNCSGARLNRAYARLAVGDLVRGWAEHEDRFELTGRSRELERFELPFWHGEPLEGRRLLVWGEQGLGDEILFASLYSELPTGVCVLECREKLAPLFARSFPQATIVPRRDPPARDDMVPVDLQIAAGSLGRLLRPSLDRFPRHEGYLVADPARSRSWGRRLAALGPGVKVGFCWRSSDLSGDRAFRCTELSQWREVFAVEDAHFICLQYDECGDELRAAAGFGARITRFDEVDYFDDLDEVAALMSSLDLVISAPTVVSIQAAAQGIPTWQLGFGADWQAHGTGRNLWLPAIRRYARRWNETWEQVLAGVARDLRREYAGPALAEARRTRAGAEQ